MYNVGFNNRALFDDLEYLDRELSPLWSIKDLDDEDEVEKWFDNAVHVCHTFYRHLFQVQLYNLLLFRGIHWLSAEKAYNYFLDRGGIANVRNPRVVLNHLNDFVTQWISRLTRYRPAVAVYPGRTNQQDIDDAKIAKDVLDYIWYSNNIDQVLQEFVRFFKIFGECYLYILWNPQKGPIREDYRRLQQQGIKIPILDSMGNPIKSEKGDPMFMNKAIHIGDIEYRIDPPWHTFDQPCRNRRDIDWSIRWEIVDVDYLKAKYPDKADKIKPQNQDDVFYTDFRGSMPYSKNQAIVYELWHRGAEFLEPGRYIKRVKGCILENTDLLYEHKQIPYIYMADIESPDHIRGMSFFQQLYPIQHQINAVGSLIYKALVLYAHPKMVVQEGSCEFQQLLNESTIVSYSGGVPPTLLTQSPIAGELFTYLNKLEETAEKLSGVYTMSRGTAPSGVRAAKALRVLEEQEDKRAYVTAVKYNNLALVENAKMTLSVAGSYYDDEDGRLAQIVGKDNQYKIIQFESSSLSRPWNIRVENSTALSQSPAARIDEIIELSNMRFDPQALLSREQTIQLLDLTASDEFKDIITRATKCAQSEIDDFLSGRPVKDPTENEDLITHWKIHLQAVQSREYKETTPEDRKVALERHILITEYLMYTKAYGLKGLLGQPLSNPNPTFMQRLLIECPDFPTTLKTPVPLGLGPMLASQGMGGPMPTPSPILQPDAVDTGANMEQGAAVNVPPMQPGAPIDNVQ